VVVNDGLVPAKGRVTVVEAATGETVLDKAYEALANGVLDLARLSWNGQGMFIIDYTVQCTAGRDAPPYQRDGRARPPDAPQTFRTHYLHGEPPFRWSDYDAWMKK
ncbi:MAG: hypothetical protein J6V72_17480, partial [Kiritimatiellae bacterium]|nr:hypothetical protein [Kiritimatiellia bacterium]